MSDPIRQPVTGARAWRSADFAGEADWLTTIDPAGVDVLTGAAAILPDDPHRWVEVDTGDIVSDAVAETIGGLAHDLDVVWVNNLAVMHRRERYIDHEDPAQRRLLYRMWLNDRQPAPVIAEHAMLRAGIRGPKPTVGADSAI